MEKQRGAKAQFEAKRCDRVGLLRDGRLRRQGTPLALATTPTAVLVGVR
jgi:ABC-type multidrug transport system ATPase subunit